MGELINKIGTFCVNRLAELVGIIIVLASIFIFASLVTYSPEDPNFIFPENTLIKNLMGSKGSFISFKNFRSMQNIVKLGSGIKANPGRTLPHYPFV